MIIASVVLVLFLVGCNSETGSETKAVVFKSASCGCCGIYAEYMDHKGFDVNVETTELMGQVKQKYDVPSHLESCHTTDVGGYFVEGHIPVEAIEKLLTEKPEIAGIAMPGMPSGSPGMPGPKDEIWTIYAVHHNGSISEFMKI